MFPKEADTMQNEMGDVGIKINAVTGYENT